MILLYISKHQQFHILVGKLLLPLKISFLICEWQKLTCFWHASLWHSRVQELKFIYIYNLRLVIWRDCGIENGHMIYLVNNKFLWNLLWCGQLTTFLHMTCSLVGVRMAKWDAHIAWDTQKHELWKVVGKFCGLIATYNSYLQTMCLEETRMLS